MKLFLTFTVMVLGFALAPKAYCEDFKQGEWEGSFTAKSSMPSEETAITLSGAAAEAIYARLSTSENLVGVNGNTKIYSKKGTQLKCTKQQTENVGTYYCSFALDNKGVFSRP